MLCDQVWSKYPLKNKVQTFPHRQNHKKNHTQLRCCPPPRPPSSAVARAVIYQSVFPRTGQSAEPQTCSTTAAGCSVIILCLFAPWTSKICIFYLLIFFQPCFTFIYFLLREGKVFSVHIPLTRTVGQTCEKQTLLWVLGLLCSAHAALSTRRPFD